MVLPTVSKLLREGQRSHTCSLSSLHKSGQCNYSCIGCVCKGFRTTRYLEKSAITFSEYVDSGARGEIMWVFGAPSNSCMGMPSWVGRSKGKMFSYIKDRVSSKPHGCKKGVLIKAMVQSIPKYVMSCFKFSKKLCSERNAQASRFWWGRKYLVTIIH